MAAQLAATVAAKLRSMPEAILSRVQAEMEALEKEMTALKDEAFALSAKYPIADPILPELAAQWEASQ